MVSRYIKEMSEEMRKQDNLATAFPLWVVYEDIRVACAHEYADNSERMAWDPEDLCDACTKLSANDEPLPNDCPKCPEDMFFFYKIERTASLKAGVFFTHKACLDHIASNHYHYSNPRPYAIGCWRNSEMQTVMLHLLKLTGEVPQQYAYEPAI